MNELQIAKSIKANGTYTMDGVEYVTLTQPLLGNYCPPFQAARAVYEARANTAAGWLSGQAEVSLRWEIDDHVANENDGADGVDWEDFEVIK